MENQKKNNKTYLLISLGVLAAIVITLGITYAYWRLTKEQTNENVVTTACLDVDIESQEDDINLPKAYPISDEDAESLVPFKFTIHNKCQDYANYDINLESMTKYTDANGEEQSILENQRLDPKYLKFKLNEESKTGVTSLLTKEKENDTSRVDPTIDNAYDAHRLLSDYIGPDTSKTYEFRLWMDGETTAEDVESMNKTFVSKISVTSTYLNEESLLPIANLELSVCNDTLTIIGNGEAKNNNRIIRYEYKLDNSDWVSSNYSVKKELKKQTAGNHKVEFRVVDSENLTSKIVTKEIEVKEQETVNLYGTDVQVVTCGDGLYKVTHEELNGTTDDDGYSQTEYRYAGDGTISANGYIYNSSLDNYVEFNGEKWRIIGKVNVKNGDAIEQRLKIVRTLSITELIDHDNTFKFYFPYNGINKNSNNWLESTLKDMLNGIYYEKTSGECYSYEDANALNWNNASKITCDFTGNSYLLKGLDEEARQMVDSDVIWNLGGLDSEDLMVSEIYEKERGETTYESNPSEWTKENDELYHNGIGLIYASDYIYALSGENGKREECFSKKLNEWHSMDINSCVGGMNMENWLHASTGNYFTLTHSSNDKHVYAVASSGLAPYSSNNTRIVPVIYLKPTVTISGGTGDYNDPYQLSIS